MATYEDIKEEIVEYGDSKAKQQALDIFNKHKPTMSFRCWDEEATFNAIHSSINYYHFVRIGMKIKAGLKNKTLSEKQKVILMGTLKNRFPERYEDDEVNYLLFTEGIKKRPRKEEVAKFQEMQYKHIYVAKNNEESNAFIEEFKNWKNNQN